VTIDYSVTSLRPINTVSLGKWHEQIPSRIETESVVLRLVVEVKHFTGEDLVDGAHLTTWLWLAGINTDIQSANTGIHSLSLEEGRQLYGLVLHHLHGNTALTAHHPLKKKTPRSSMDSEIHWPVQLGCLFLWDKKTEQTVSIL